MYKIEAVIFDMDGLLIDSEPFWQQAEVDVFSKMGYKMTVEMCQQMAGLRVGEVVKHWQALYKWVTPTQEVVIQQITDRVIELSQTKGKALPGAIETLKFIKKLGLKTALASSSSMKVIEALLEILKIKDEFEVIKSAEFEEYGKPHPAVFINTATELGVNPLNCLVLEDSLYGIIAAKAARMKVVAVPSESDFHKIQFRIADIKLSSLEEFTPKVLEELNNM